MGWSIRLAGVACAIDGAPAGAAIFCNLRQSNSGTVTYPLEIHDDPLTSSGTHYRVSNSCQAAQMGQRLTLTGSMAIKAERIYREKADTLWHTGGTVLVTFQPPDGSTSWPHTINSTLETSNGRS